MRKENAILIDRLPRVRTRAFSSRELSRLEFGGTSLGLADDQRLPILERFKFVAIFADMVDEFFQVRVVSLEDKVAAGVQTPSVDGIRPRQQLSAIRERVLSLVERQDRIVLDTLLPTWPTRHRSDALRDLDDVEKKRLTSSSTRTCTGFDAARGRPGSSVPHDLDLSPSTSP